MLKLPLYIVLAACFVGFVGCTLLVEAVHDRTPRPAAACACSCEWVDGGPLR
jgi:hypothetical protein